MHGKRYVDVSLAEPQSHLAINGQHELDDQSGPTDCQ
jgi:hypothetical protein